MYINTIDQDITFEELIAAFDRVSVDLDYQWLLAANYIKDEAILNLIQKYSMSENKKYYLNVLSEKFPEYSEKINKIINLI